MKLHYLGTAAAEGWPGIFCNCEACKKAIEYGGRNIRSRQQVLLDDRLLFDMPADTYMHAVMHGIDLSAIETVLFTHSHCDHYFTDDLTMRGGGYSYKMKAQSLRLFGNETVEKLYRERTEAVYECAEISDPISYEYVKPFKPFKTGSYTVTPLLARHDPRENCYIYIVEDEEKRMLYGNDTGIFPDETWEYIKGKYFDLVSLDCTSGMEEKEVGGGHMGLLSNRIIRNRMREFKCCNEKTKWILTHFSHNSKLIYDELKEIVELEDFIVAYDGMIVEI